MINLQIKEVLKRWNCLKECPICHSKEHSLYTHDGAWVECLECADHIADTSKKVYTPEQVKRIALSFFDAFPKHDSLHMESIFEAWFDKYGSKL